MDSLSKSRFLNIDALRGIAAFGVVIYHVFGSYTIFQETIRFDNVGVGGILYFIPATGFAGVYLFFVISGFCIHLRWCKATSKGDPDPHPDFFEFWKRRWIRLYPAYLVAIGLFVIFLYQKGQLAIDGFFIWDMISHVLMIHNLDSRTVYSMNGVFWTLAIEEQLYLLYFLLLYMRRKWGWGLTLALCFTMRFVWLGFCLLVGKVVGFEIPFQEAAFANWWIWVLGAIAIENYYGIIKLPKWCFSPYLSCISLLTAFASHYVVFSTPSNKTISWAATLFEPYIWGVGFFFLINYVMRFEGTIRKRTAGYWIVSVCAAVGLFSYSLYLTHEIVLRPLSNFNGFLVCLITLAFGYVFFLLFEKPFMKILAKRKASR